MDPGKHTGQAQPNPEQARIHFRPEYRVDI